MLSSVLLALLIQAQMTYGYEISTNNGGPWGNWGEMKRCPPGTSARGFSIKVENPINGDDTALNGIRLYCAHPGSRDVNNPITSTVGPWGDWTDILWCPSGSLSTFHMRVERSLGTGDDTAANNIVMKCSDNTILPGDGCRWGTLGSWSETCPRGICGIQTKVELPRGKGDDTALNDVIFECC